MVQCTLEEIAAALHCSEATLIRRFASVIKEGRAEGRTSIRRKQMELAMRGNVAMLIWVGKTVLGQREMVDVREHSTVSFSPDEENRVLEAAAQEWAARQRADSGGEG